MKELKQMRKNILQFSDLWDRFRRAGWHVDETMEVSHSRLSFNFLLPGHGGPTVALLPTLAIIFNGPRRKINDRFAMGRCR